MFPLNFSSLENLVFHSQEIDDVDLDAGPVSPQLCQDFADRIHQEREAWFHFERFQNLGTRLLTDLELHLTDANHDRVIDETEAKDFSKLFHTRCPNIPLVSQNSESYFQKIEDFIYFQHHREQIEKQIEFGKIMSLTASLICSASFVLYLSSSLAIRSNPVPQLKALNLISGVTMIFGGILAGAGLAVHRWTH